VGSNLLLSVGAIAAARLIPPTPFSLRFSLSSIRFVLVVVAADAAAATSAAARNSVVSVYRFIHLLGRFATSFPMFAGNSQKDQTIPVGISCAHPALTAGCARLMVLGL